jgi:cysteine desulfurase / selenocysteine lyase
VTAARDIRPSELDVERIRGDFPALHQKVRGKPLVYLDNAATSQKPRAVLDAIVRYYSEDNANVHRGVHTLSERATKAYEGARGTVRRFLNAERDSEIVFVRGTTEAINLVAQTFARGRVGSGDEVVITTMEHHSNIVPWQMLCEQKGARLRVAPINDAGELRLEALEDLIGARTKMLALPHVSNALGTVNPVRKIVALAHGKGVPVLVDGAQAVPHMAVDVRALGCDFYAFSGHKLYGPTGIGALYAKAEHLEAMPPYQGGGDMIASVTFEKTLYNKPPYKFEAGTPDIAGAIGLGAAIDYVASLGMDRIAAYEDALLAYGTRALESVPGLRLIGTAHEKAGVLSFILGDIHPHDIGTVLDREGIAVRSGHHCAQPVMERFGVPATARASLAFYNTRAEIDALVAGLAKVREVFA